MINNDIDFKNTIKKTAEYKYYLHAILLFLFVQAIALIATIISFVSVGIYGLIILFVFCIIFSPFLIYYWVKMLGLSMHKDKYIYQSALFDKPVSNFFMRGYYFTIKINLAPNNIITVDTITCFGPILSQVNLEDVINKKLLVGYNTVTGKLITIIEN